MYQWLLLLFAAIAVALYFVRCLWCCCTFCQQMFAVLFNNMCTTSRAISWEVRGGTIIMLAAYQTSKHLSAAIK